MTESQKSGMQEVIDKMNWILSEISSIKYVENASMNLPETAEPDELEVRDTFKRIYQVYETIGNHGKSLVNDKTDHKLAVLKDSLWAYKVIKNEKAIWNGGDLTITANGAASELIRIEADGNVVDASNYSVVSGSTILTFKESYLNSLPSDTYALAFVYPEGLAMTTFTIPSKQAQPTSTIKPLNPEPPVQTPSKVVNTGVKNDVVWYGGIIVIGFILGVAIHLFKKKAR